MFSITKACPTDSFWPCGLGTTRLHCPRNFPGSDTGVGWHFLPQGIFLTQGLNPSPTLAGRFFTTEPPGKPLKTACGPPLPPGHCSLAALSHPRPSSRVGGGTQGNGRVNKAALPGALVACTPFLSQSLSPCSAAGPIKHFNSRVC